MIHLNAGDRAPFFSLSNQNGNIVKLDDFKGKKLLVYFYPKADTPGCTKQACSIRDSKPDLKQTGISAVGISPDKPEKLKKFEEKYDLGFSLLSDEDHSVSEAYGVWGEKIRCGKTCTGITRSSFLVGEDGKIIKAWYNVKPDDTIPNVLNIMAAK